MIRNKLVTLLVLAATLTACGGASQGGDFAPLGTEAPTETFETLTVDGITPTPPPLEPIESFTPRSETSVPRLSNVLSDLYLSWQTDPVKAEAVAREEGLEIEGDRVFGWLVLEDATFSDSITQSINNLDGEVTTSFDIWIDAWIPIPNLEAIANLPGVLYIREPLPLDQHDPVTP